ncbi:hypothetical protein [Seonamhaeicola maritimus]|uniref:hypothetical protein n=1 Tax=Seonamhaeicola maritimus TaxID=2591822 RepID=UPI002493E151|nr:hypothetical protein [Seonamhaeicola maritimus]
MKTIISLVLVLLLFCSCTDKKKEEDKIMKQTIQKIDSLEQNISKDIEELKDITKQVEDNLKEIDSI